MKIVADPNIPLAREAFAEFGEVTLVPGRELSREHLTEATVLLVRSVTRVDADLLQGTPVRFVGTATAGIDHVDREFLERRSIDFASAPGSNAEAVADYVLSALLAVFDRRGEGLSGKTAGIVGCGQVGSRVLDKLRALGVECLVNDPPLAQQHGADGFVDLELLTGADIVTLHVPLNAAGPWPTVGLIDGAFLRGLRAGAVVINTARGSVLDESALLGLLRERSTLSAVIDCWEHEPAIDAELLDAAALGTPHIAGYSQDAKLRATQVLYDALCARVGREPGWTVPPSALTELAPLHIGADLRGPEEVLKAAVFACYDARRDDRALRRAGGGTPEALRREFDRLRRNYPPRREFAALEVVLPSCWENLGERLQRVGFRVSRSGTGAGC